MLRDTIEKYLKLFAEAGSRRDTQRCSELGDEVGRELRDNPPTIEEILGGLDDISDNRSPPGAFFLLRGSVEQLGVRLLTDTVSNR